MEQFAKSHIESEKIVEYVFDCVSPAHRTKAHTFEMTLKNNGIRFKKYLTDGKLYFYVSEPSIQDNTNHTTTSSILISKVHQSVENRL